MALSGAQVIVPYPAAGPSTKAFEKTKTRLKNIQLMPCRTVAEVPVTDMLVSGVYMRCSYIRGCSKTL